VTLSRSHRGIRLRVAAAAIALALPALAYAAATPAVAAASKGCEGGGYRVLGKTAPFDGSVAAPSGRFLVQGKYNQFEIRPSDFAAYNYTFTGAPNPLDITGGHVTPIYASRVPDHRGLVLTSRISLTLDAESISVSRTGPGLSMKITALDCASGGVFQMEPQRGDGTRTRIVHRLASAAFYFDNANFRAHLGEFVGSGCTSTVTGPPGQFCVQVKPRVNIGNDVSSKFVVRDSPQVADRVPQSNCGPDFTDNLGFTETADHCGGMSIWDVASGGRMGIVTGEDATEVANPATTCTHKCQAQDQVRGRLANLGFPFPVPAGSRLTPRVSAQGLDAPLTP
jgi:hypothetical protein